MLKEDMEFMGAIRLSDVKKSQERIFDIVHYLEQIGEIVISYQKGEFVE
jgi:flagellar motor switch protein FliG